MSRAATAAFSSAPARAPGPRPGRRRPPSPRRRPSPWRARSRGSPASRSRAPAPPTTGAVAFSANPSASAVRSSPSGHCDAKGDAKSAIPSAIKPPYTTNGRNDVSVTARGETSSGRARPTATSTSAVMSPSPTPISMCTPAMAGRATDHPTVRDTASSPAHATDASTVLHQPANAAASTRPNIPPTARLTKWKIAQPPTPPTMPMLKMFAPSAVMPPSANIRHCTISTDAMTITETLGPSSAATSTPPTRWPEVPPATGKLIICAANTNAAASPSSGTRCGGRCWRACRSATPTPAAPNTPVATAVFTSRNPSGMCMISPRRLAPPTGPATRLLPSARSRAPGSRARSGPAGPAPIGRPGARAAAGDCPSRTAGPPPSAPPPVPG